MGKVYSTIAGLLLFVVSVRGQGTMLFTWHGDSNYFQATFQVPSDELQPGALFGQMFLDTMSVTNPVGQTYHGGDTSSAGSGTYIPWNLSFQLNDFQRGTELIISGGGLSGSNHRTAGVMWEQLTSSTDFLWFETGYWSVAQVPEPSTATLLAFAGCLWLLRRVR